jgi:hypothetical protein
MRVKVIEVVMGKGRMQRGEAEKGIIIRENSRSKHEVLRVIYA